MSTSVGRSLESSVGGPAGSEKVAKRRTETIRPAGPDARNEHSSGEKPIFEFLMQHQFWAAVGIYWIFSAAVSSMPDPGANGSPGYVWLYRFLHTTAGNITTALLTAARYRACASSGSKIPGLKTLIPLLVPLLLSTAACAAHYTIHPGALNPNRLGGL